MNILQQIAQATKTINELKPVVEGAVRDFVTCVRQIDLEAIQKAIAEVQRFAEAAPQLKETCTEANIRLSENGWHIGGEIPARLYMKVARLAVGITDGCVDEIAVPYFKNRIQLAQTDDIKFPDDRRDIIRSGVDAHLRCEFSVSVPLFLMQADGICHDVWSAFYFTDKAKRGKRKLSDQVESHVLGSILDEIIAPLRKNPGRRPFWLRERSQIIHGTNTSYGSELNSLKAFSLLDYFAWLYTERPQREKSALSSDGPAP